MNYEQLLRDHNLKATPQRVGILSHMHCHGHVTVDTLFREIQKEFSSISLATLYKNIHAMLGTALIKEVRVPEQKCRYEIAKTPHAHLLCEQCGKFEDFTIDLDSILQQAMQQSHYTLTKSDLILSGTCSECQ